MGLYKNCILSFVTQATHSGVNGTVLGCEVEASDIRLIDDETVEIDMMAHEVELIFYGISTTIAGKPIEIPRCKVMVDLSFTAEVPLHASMLKGNTRNGTKVATDITKYIRFGHTKVKSPRFLRNAEYNSYLQENADFADVVLALLRTDVVELIEEEIDGIQIYWELIIGTKGLRQAR